MKREKQITYEPAAPLHSRLIKGTSKILFGVLLGQVIIYSGLQDMAISSVKSAEKAASPVQTAEAAPVTQSAHADGQTVIMQIPPMPYVQGVENGAKEMHTTTPAAPAHPLRDPTKH